MTVQAKFQVDAVTHRHTGATESCLVIVTMKAAIGPGNEDWSKWTPHGDITLTLTNSEAVQHFTPGSFHMLTFERVD